MSQIQRAAEAVLDFLKIGSGALEITGCWANVSSPGAHHRMHTHPNNFLSGVYYVRVANGTDTINSHDPMPQAAIIRPAVTRLTLILFPAWLPHSVDTSRSDRKRISVSFNLMFASYAETMSAPLWGTSGQHDVS